MKLPRDISGREFGRLLSTLGYAFTHEEGSHRRYTTQVSGEHHITIPDHDPIRLGTLNHLLSEVAEHHKLDRQQLLRMLFDKH